MSIVPPREDNLFELDKYSETSDSFLLSSIERLEFTLAYKGPLLRGLSSFGVEIPLTVAGYNALVSLFIHTVAVFSFNAAPCSFSSLLSAGGLPL